MTDIERDGDHYYVTTRWLPELQRYLMVEVSKEEYTTSIRQRFLSSIELGLLLLVQRLAINDQRVRPAQLRVKPAHRRQSSRR